MRHAIPHDLELSQAIAATHRAAEAYTEKLARYEPHVEWRSDTHADIAFRARGFHLRGSLDVEPRAVVFHLDVPLLLRPFQSLAVPVLEREVKAWIEKARSAAP